ncbi:MAG TPA: hypothetical protein VFZ61_32980 [Polyangiales bacterium]
MNHDARLRARLRALAEQEALPQLDASARARTERAALAELGPARARARYVRGGAWALAAALSLWVGTAWLSGESVPQRAAAPSGSERGTAPTAAPAALILAPAAADGCTESLRWSADQRGRPQLDLGERALLIASADARVSGGLRPSCDTEIALAAGTLSVHARKLGGRALTLRTALGAVRVKGTIFSVSLSPDQRELVVQVDEGVVELSAGGGATDVVAGQALALRSKGRRKTAWSLAARNQLRALLGLAPRSESPAREAQDAGEQPLEAPSQPRVWQSGTLPAPNLAPEPGSSIDEDGRPLTKPRLIEGGTLP